MKTKSVVYHAFVIAFGLLMIYPLIWTFASSFKPDAEILADSTFNNYSFRLQMGEL